jgi:beta-phosphoglucomutase-like phosphatase (HAD superfamily)
VSERKDFDDNRTPVGVAKYRARLQARIDVLRRIGTLDVLVAAWPEDLPTLKRSEAHTTRQLGTIKRLIVEAEKVPNKLRVSIFETHGYDPYAHQQRPFVGVGPFGPALRARAAARTLGYYADVHEFNRDDHGREVATSEERAEIERAETELAAAVERARKLAGIAKGREALARIAAMKLLVTQALSASVYRNLGASVTDDAPPTSIVCRHTVAPSRPGPKPPTFPRRWRSPEPRGTIL